MNRVTTHEQSRNLPCLPPCRRGLNHPPLPVLRNRLNDHRSLERRQAMATDTGYGYVFPNATGSTLYYRTTRHFGKHDSRISPRAGLLEIRSFRLLVHVRIAAIIGADAGMELLPIEVQMPTACSVLLFPIHK